MARAFDVARYLVDLAAWEEEPDYLTHLRLQKLLYYVQGWSLSLRDSPLFNERIEAWANGPVVRDLYPMFAGYGSYPITSDSVTASCIPFDAPQELDPAEREVVQAVWNVYKDYSASHLWKMTHEEPPWRDARGNLGPADRSSNEITQAAMKAYFDSLAVRGEHAQG